MKVPSRAELGHFNFRAETEVTILTICMSILVPTPKLQSNFLIFMNMCKTIDIFGVEYYDLVIIVHNLIIFNPILLK
jgi:hypothetical protein